MDYCSKCGAELKGDGRYCLNCGAEQTTERQSVKSKWNYLSIAGFAMSVFGAVSEAFFLLLLAAGANILTGILLLVSLPVNCFVGSIGVILSSVGLGLTVRKKQRGLAFAIIGLALGVACVATYVIFQINPNLF